jgi:hypothetical protein
MVALGPIPHEFTNTEATIARAGYQVFTMGRAERPWEYLQEHERYRWKLAANLVCEHPDVRADEIRDRKLADMAHVSWNDVPQEEIDRWSRVAGAMRATRTRISVEARMVISG